MRRSELKRFDTMNVIPLIDVMLVLLAIVLMTASFIVKDSLNIELPETTNTQTYVPAENITPVLLHINAENQYFINEQPESFANISQRLSKLSKEQAITLQVDKKAEFGTFVKLVDALKGQELNNLSILTKSQQQ
ncbi:biopolymer transport protein ExbD [Thiomicrorhabdus immobilis]|uniref:Biopolymer transport protein ExbD n=1 Tax=Thiomicrorhabdus immobilis TaxID=2791037 RepID=A0ABN6CW52_9GAMM|nr:biopolymer transporter ExbD [Thiomicrorhabdus immobilis]BCN92889.1 biopolymer transport protein ExbD [Thiomicrorhabdus immobilis]